MAKSGGTTRTRYPSQKGMGNQKQMEHTYTNGTTSEMVSYLKRYGGYSTMEATEVAEDIYKWSYGYDRRVSDYQLGKGEDEDGKRIANTIESFIQRMPKWNGGTTFRGIKDMDMRRLFNSLPVGSEWEPQKSSSWSSTEENAKYFAKVAPGMKNLNKDAIVLRCYDPQNGTSITALSRFPQEREVLKIIGKSINPSGVLYVDLQPV